MVREKRYTPEIKAKVALETIREEKTMEYSMGEVLQWEEASSGIGIRTPYEVYYGQARCSMN